MGMRTDATDKRTEEQGGQDRDQANGEIRCITADFLEESDGQGKPFPPNRRVRIVKKWNCPYCRQMEFPLRSILPHGAGPVLALACLLALFAAPAAAGELRLAVPDLPPYGSRTPKEEAGLFAELAEAIAAGAGFTPEVVVLAPEQIIPAMDAGKVEAALLFPDPDMETRAEDLGEVTAVDVVAVGRAGTVLRIRRDLAGKRVAVVRNCHCDGGLSRHDGATPLPATNFDRALRLLLAGQVGAVVGPWPAILAAVDRSGRTRRILGTPLVLSRTAAHLFLSSGANAPATRQRLAKGLEKLRESGTLNKIITNHALSRI